MPIEKSDMPFIEDLQEFIGKHSGTIVIHYDIIDGAVHKTHIAGNVEVETAFSMLGKAALYYQGKQLLQDGERK